MFAGLRVVPRKGLYDAPRIRGHTSGMRLLAEACQARGSVAILQEPLGIQYRAESNASWDCGRREAALDALNDKATQLVAGTHPLTQNFFLVQINRS